MAAILVMPFIPDNFITLGDWMLNHTILMVAGCMHRICEVEFYLHSPQHPDQYVHGHTDQTHAGIWYFHRHNNRTYRNGTFKGLDLALGSKGIHAAILIWSILDITRNIFIEGPCKVVNYILALYQTASIFDFTNNQSLNAFQNDKGLVLVEGTPTKIEPLLYGPRIGLSDKYPAYRDRKYRFVIGPVKKERKKLLQAVT